MKRPTCRTCPYWAIDEDFGISPETDLDEDRPRNFDPDAILEWSRETGKIITAECKRYPRKDKDEIFKHDFEWCGEHPDFPAYITSLKDDAGDDLHRADDPYQARYPVPD